MRPIKRLLVVENEPKDIQVAAAIAQQLGIDEVDARTSLDAARSYLDKRLQENGPLPDAILLDLDLGYDSGYELLRYWHSTPGLSQIPMIVWSILGDEQRAMCNLFRVHRYVAKWEGEAALREALLALEPAAN